MFIFYLLSFFKKGDTIQGGTLFKEIWYVDSQRNRFINLTVSQKFNPDLSKLLRQLIVILFLLSLKQCAEWLGLEQITTRTFSNTLLTEFEVVCRMVGVVDIKTFVI